VQPGDLARLGAAQLQLQQVGEQVMVAADNLTSRPGIRKPG
jgi:hypothetical protein